MSIGLGFLTSRLESEEGTNTSEHFHKRHKTFSKPKNVARRTLLNRLLIFDHTTQHITVKLYFKSDRLMR